LKGKIALLGEVQKVNIVNVFKGNPALN